VNGTEKEHVGWANLGKRLPPADVPDMFLAAKVAVAKRTP
jgi:hypothetical protein